MNTISPISSLKTSTPEDGWELSKKLSESIESSLKEAQSKEEKPGGMSFGSQPLPSPATTASILFVAISIANQGWNQATTVD